MIDVSGTPYYLGAEGEARAVDTTLRQLTERVELLRKRGKLTDATLKDYYGEKRFEQVAESNALEGSTLSVGETELAVLKGTTLTGHDPAYIRDAQTLARAVDEIVVMARDQTPTDVQQVKHLHELILGERPSAGAFRSSAVRIGGSAHTPPKTWREVMDQMEEWEAWSRRNAGAPPVLRGVVLHAWLEHIHPFIDGNGRTGRAINNLELVRAGYPPIIIRKHKDRDQYIEALGQADGGDLGPFIDLVAGRMDDALRDLERAAERREGYSVQREKELAVQRRRLALWNAGVHLLFESIRAQLSERFIDSPTDLQMREFDELGVEDFIELCEGRSVRRTWAFTVRCAKPGMPPLAFLAWAGFMAPPLSARLQHEPGRPALMWSVPNPDRYPPWLPAGTISPGGAQMTIHKDRWLVARDGKVADLAPSALAERICRDIAERMIPTAEL